MFRTWGLSCHVEKQDPFRTGLNDKAKGIVVAAAVRYSGYLDQQVLAAT